MPALNDCKFIIVNELVIVRLFIELKILYLLVSDTFIIVPLKYQLILGSGSPVAWQLNVTGFVSFSSKSGTSSVISA